jgi:hypothetical protein
MPEVHPNPKENYCGIAQGTKMRAVLNRLGSPASRRVYEYAIDQFIAWYARSYLIIVKDLSQQDLRSQCGWHCPLRACRWSTA